MKISSLFLILFLIVTSNQAFGQYRIGAVCNDGSRSKSIGSGTCSYHGGVSYWIYSDDNQRNSYRQDDLYSNSPSNKFPIEYLLPMNSFPNTRYNEKENFMTWRPDGEEGTMYQRLRNSISINHGTDEFVIQFLETSGSNIFEYPVTDQNRGIMASVYRYSNGRIKSSEFDVIMQGNSMFPIFDELEFHVVNNRNIIVLPVRTGNSETYNEELVVYELQNGHVRYLQSNLVSEQQGMDESTKSQYNFVSDYHLFASKENVFLEMRLEFDGFNPIYNRYLVGDSEITFEDNIHSSNSKKENSSNISSTGLAEETYLDEYEEPYHTMGRDAGTYNLKIAYIGNYHEALLKGDVEGAYQRRKSDILIDYYDKGMLNLELVKEDHNKYKEKYEILRAEFNPDLIVSTYIEGKGDLVKYPMIQQIRRRKDGKIFGYHLSCSMVFDADYNIVGVDSRIIKRFNSDYPGTIDDLYKSYGSPGSSLDENNLKSRVERYHEVMKEYGYESIMVLYDKKVDYYDKGFVDKTYIEENHGDYFNKYRIINYDILPDSWDIRNVNGSLHASYKMNYIIVRESDQKVFKYILDNTMGINENFLIIQVDAKIVKRLD